MNNNKELYLKGDSFIIENYDKKKPFASFLPGVAGLDGIPIWAFYTNRGQGIAGFGVENKDGAILDFVPANKAYRRTEIEGFRTFIKKDGNVHEIFSSNTGDLVKRKMSIGTNSVGFTEKNLTLKLKVDVKFFTVTDEKYPGLVRKVEITPLSEFTGEIQVADGLMTLWPYGNSNYAIKDMSNLSVAWFETYNTENGMPFFRNRSTTSDSAEVGEINEGHFFAAYSNKSTEPLDVIYDPLLLFGTNTSLSKADGLEEDDLKVIINKKQYSANKIPCAYAVYDGNIDDKLIIASITGRINSVEKLNETAERFSIDYIQELEERAEKLGESLVLPVEAKTAIPEFDAYVRQTFLDNLLRGGYPILFDGKSGPMVFHVYSRIHGDMEREYNNFVIEPSYYSQGIGAFRDVNQNRRNDVFFVREAGLFNVRLFMEMIQMDGQNPLSIRGSRFQASEEEAEALVKLVVTGGEKINKIICGEFTPGLLLKYIDDYGVELKVSRHEFLNEVMGKSNQIIKGSYGHGFWADHWTYNMDLVDNYLAIYPDMLENLMFHQELRYFISPAKVLPREDKYVINKEGKIRQYDAILIDEKRLTILGIEPNGTNWHRDKKGEVVKTNLFVKLLSLVLNKISNLDQSGIGIMMNTDKPGWNDSMNGLPGLFGSGTSETIELGRIIEFLQLSLQFDEKVILPKELFEFYIRYKGLLLRHLEGKIDNLELFESAQRTKEAYNELISMELSGESETVPVSSFGGFLKNAAEKIESAIQKAVELGDGIPPSYIIHDALDYKLIEGKKHPVNGMQNVIVTRWIMRSLPLYLEAPARYLKQLHDRNKSLELYKKIMGSGMYDKKLKMYVTSESLENETLEIGRARAFSAGWLERESVFMHMEYKYLLGILKSGLYQEFFEAIKTAFPPFMDPEIYGRSILENSSFIASSRNPDPENHGRGFVSRLTGTTSELISIWLIMMTGWKMFKMEDELVFSLNPVLSSDFFDENNEVRCKIFSNTEIVYKNPGRKHTYGSDGVSVKSYTIFCKNGTTKALDRISGVNAHDVRNGEIRLIEALLI